MKLLVAKYLLYAMLLGSLTACNSWLDVESKDRIMENNLFSSRSGFMTALNGVYIELNDASLYGRTLTSSTVDILAQYYNAGTDHKMKDLAAYTDVNMRDAFNPTWSKAYTLIANCNAIIENCDEKRGMLGQQYYDIICGEALALRALLHFDLLRIYGPVYNVEPDMPCIPYALTSELIVRPLLKANEVGSYVLTDLLEAEKLLKNSDPIITEGVLFSDLVAGGSNDLRYRTLRFNYYAVQIMIARVALYIGGDKKSMAFEYAKKIIALSDTEKPLFHFTTRSQAALDKVFQSELLFALQNMKRKEIFDDFFSNKLQEISVLRPLEGRLQEMYKGYGSDNVDETDYRYSGMWESLENSDEKTFKYFVKYNEVQDEGAGFRYMIPMLRLSEAFLIAAECAGEGAGINYLNTLRNARGIQSLPESTDLQQEITHEYKREFIGEGQLFWYYKRTNTSEISSGSNMELSYPMDKSKYVIRLPVAEESMRE